MEVYKQGARSLVWLASLGSKDLSNTTWCGWWMSNTSHLSGLNVEGPGWTATLSCHRVLSKSGVYSKIAIWIWQHADNQIESIKQLESISVLKKMNISLHPPRNLNCRSAQLLQHKNELSIWVLKGCLLLNFHAIVWRIFQQPHCRPYTTSCRYPEFRSKTNKSVK